MTKKKLFMCFSNKRDNYKIYFAAQWQDYGEWSACSPSTRRKSRYRTCVKPVCGPSNCVGSTEQTKKCCLDPGNNSCNLVSILCKFLRPFNQVWVNHQNRKQIKRCPTQTAVISIN